MEVIEGSPSGCNAKIETADQNLVEHKVGLYDNELAQIVLAYEESTSAARPLPWDPPPRALPPVAGPHV